MTEAPTTEAPKTDDPRLGIGGNNPPFEVELAERRAPLKARVENLIVRMMEAPNPVETPEQHELCVALKSEADGLLKEIESEHEEEKGPLAAKTKVIDAFFLTKGLKGRLEPQKNTIAQRNGKYQDDLAKQRAKQAQEAAEEAAKLAAAKVDEAAALEAEGRHTEASVKMEGAQAQEQHAQALASQAQAPTKDLGRTFTAAGSSSLIITATPVVDPDKIDLEKLRPFLAIDALETAVRAMIRAKGLKAQDLLDGKLAVAGLSFERKVTGR